jgi:hypothetical protein
MMSLALMLLLWDDLFVRLFLFTVVLRSPKLKHSNIATINNAASVAIHDLFFWSILHEVSVGPSRPLAE